MDNEELLRRKSLSFSEAEGYEPLPTQLTLGELPNGTKARLWAVVHEQIKFHESSSSHWLRPPFRDLARKYFVEEKHGMADEFSPDVRRVEADWKTHFEPHKKYHETLNFVQWLLRNHPEGRFRAKIANVFKDTLSAYRVVDGSTIMPIGSEQEGRAIQTALAITADAGMLGSRRHLLDAGASLSSGNFANSVRESISAVEAVAFAATGEKSFSKAIAVMDARRPMNGAFKIAINQLYNYTSQEPGIRHAKKENASANVDEREAIFMLGVCASFITYVLAE
ncbi:hypothetical protein GOC72_18855 [Sinorhizobium medicae]|nr:hypothetical protein [Sinorhizobium medicae]